MKEISPFKSAAACIAVLFTIAFSITNQSCRDNMEREHVPQQSGIDKNAGTENRMLSYNQFLQQIKDLKDKKLYNHFKTSAEAALRTSEIPLFPIRTLPSTTDSIRRISVNKHTTYTIPVYRRNHTGEVFRNIIIDSSNAGVQAYLAWYFPDKNWIKEYKTDRSRSFYGRVFMTDYDDILSDARSGNRVNLLPVCTSVMVLSEVVEHLCCHNMQHASCNCPGSSQYHFEYVYNTVTTCIDAYIPPGGGTPGGTGGGSGGTVPNPGGGYDPCEQTKIGASKTPCPPTTPSPGPVITPNAAAAPLVSTAKAKGINFTSTEIAVLNEMEPTMIARIKDLISAFGDKVTKKYGELILILNEGIFNAKEIEALDALSDNIESYKRLTRMMYAANAYAAQTFTGAKYNAFGSTCSNCKANAFKHALFLIFNAETFSKESAMTLAAGHEDGQVGLDTEMDKKNNAAGVAIYDKFNASGTPFQWADRVKAATTAGQYGLVFVKNFNLVSTSNIDPTCPN